MLKLISYSAYSNINHIYLHYTQMFIINIEERKLCMYFGEQIFNRSEMISHQSNTEKIFLQHKHATLRKYDV